jgi:hypothetical protein
MASFLNIEQLTVTQAYETAYTKSINLVMHLSSPSSPSSPSSTSSSSSSSSSPFSYFSNSRRMLRHRCKFLAFTVYHANWSWIFLFTFSSIPKRSITEPLISRNFSVITLFPKTYNFLNQK